MARLAQRTPCTTATHRWAALCLSSICYWGKLYSAGWAREFTALSWLPLSAMILAGLMIGRMPEYLGKKIGPLETKFITLYVLACPLAVLPFTAIALATKAGLSGLITNKGSHGLTEILYAYSSSFANNGQAFAGLNANTVFYNFTTAVAMMIGRFGLAIPALAAGGTHGSTDPKAGSRKCSPYRRSPVRRAADCDGSDCRRIEFLPSANIGSDSRTPDSSIKRDIEESSRGFSWSSQAGRIIVRIGAAVPLGVSSAQAVIAVQRNNLI